MFGLKKIVRLYKDGNVSVCGMKGRGKDLLMGNVVARRKAPYISNMNYGGMYIPLDLNMLMVGNNDYLNFISGELKQYTYPYCDKADIYISDCGVYFPSQYNIQLDKRFGNFSTFLALSRHLGEANVHTNSQALGRVWIKLREQSDVFIRCERCKVFFGKIVLQSVIIYDKASSAEDGVKPCRIRVPLLGNTLSKVTARNQIDSFANTYGTVKRRFLVYWNKAKYDTRMFKGVLENAKK